MILEPNGEKKPPTSPRVSDKHSSRDVGLELPVYDKVSLVRVPSQGETAEGVEYDQLSRPRKQSLPANLGDLPTISQYSVLNTSAHPKQRKKTPVYSVPDAKKKRERHWKKKQSSREAKIAASRKASSSSCPPLPLLSESEGEQEYALESEEGRYPFITVPHFLKPVKPMPTRSASSMEDTVQPYDCDSNKLILAPSDDDVFLYDQPTSLFLDSNGRRKLCKRRL